MAMAKMLLLGFPIALWYLISQDWGWGTVLMIVPVTFFIGLAFTVILEWFIQPLVRWINK